MSLLHCDINWEVFYIDPFLMNNLIEQFSSHVNCMFSVYQQILRHCDIIQQALLCFVQNWVVFIYLLSLAPSCHNLFKIHRDFLEMMKLQSALYSLLYSLCLCLCWSMIIGSNLGDRLFVARPVYFVSLVQITLGDFSFR